MSTLDTAISAAASALRAERVRIETSVSNIANAETTRGPDGLPYRRKDVVLASDPMNSFDSILGAASTGVKVAAVVEDQQPFDRRYQPSHPDADSEGYISLPNVDPAEEMVDMLGATRAYQANLAAVGLIRDLMNRALELGKG
jgi:flagellar basal-body rod protein FlgC